MEKDLINIIRENGIVGAGGAGFPTHVKVNAKADVVIINGAECEPLLRVDQQLLALESRKILDSLSLVMKAVGANKGVIGLKDKYKNAIKNLETILDDYPNIELHKMTNFYPAGDEQVLVYEVTGKVIPEGAIPLSVGAIVLNVETILNIHNAYVDNMPVIDKYVTVTGEVKNKITVKVPIGITVQEVLELAGGCSIDEFVVINGGPMMGKIVSLEEKITKTTKGLIVLPKNHTLINSLNKDINRILKEAKSACMHCSHCTEVCPRNLIGHNIHPNKLIRMASYSSICDDNISPTTAFLCCECRLCEYACIMDLQPWKLHHNLKKQMSNNGIKNNNNAKGKPHPYRSYRRYPVTKLIRKLGLIKYDENADITDPNKSFNTVEILLKQHIGSPATPIVYEDDIIIKGQLIANIEGNKLGSNIHSSIDGIVLRVTNESITIKSHQ